MEFTTAARRAFVLRRTWPVMILTSLVLATALQGCLPIIAGGIVAGTYAATDRRSLRAQTDDKVIAAKADSRISAEFGDATHVDVNVFNRKVLLTGEVPTPEAKERVERIVNGIENVTGVVNEVAVSPASSVASRSSDAFLTTSVKARLVSETDVYANAFKVVTERGTVYLMGRVTQREGDYAANIARQVSGVLAVVKVFDYITEDQLKDMLTKASPEAN